MALRSVIWPSGVTITTGIPRRDAQVRVWRVPGVVPPEIGVNAITSTGCVSSISTFRLGAGAVAVAPPVRGVLLDQPAELAGDLASDAIGPTRGAMHDQRGRGRAAHGFTSRTQQQSSTTFHIHNFAERNNNNNKQALPLSEVVHVQRS